MVLCQTKKICALCKSLSSKHTISEKNIFFCCHGCLAVYQILDSKNELSNFEEHSIFKQAVKSGLISNPDLLSQIQSKSVKFKENEIEKIYLEVLDMWCPSCAELIYYVLMQEQGVTNAVVDYSTDLCIIEFSPRLNSKANLIKVIKSLHYRAYFPENKEDKQLNESLYLKFVVGAFCSFNVMMFSYPLYASYLDYDPLQYGSLFAKASFFMTLPVVTFCFWPILKRFWIAAKYKTYGMESLVVLGVFSSFFLSCYELIHGRTYVYFDSLTVIVTFVLLGKVIEAKAKFSLKNSWIRLNLALPKRARKYHENGNLEFVPIKKIKKGDVFVVLQGEKIPLDGVVLEGTCAADESLMTGESIPVNKRSNCMVIGGSIIQNGRISVKATSVDHDSTLSMIIQMLETGLKSKSHYTRALDPLIKYFVPFVLLISLLSGLYSFFVIGPESAFIQALSVLLISCPCAIGVAAPLAESYLMNRLATHGAVVRNRGVLSLLGKETVFVFDKTGTITEGKFRVISGLEILSDDELSILKGMTSLSMHSIAKAITDGIQNNAFKVEEMEEIAGKGLRACVSSNVYHLGSSLFFNLEGIFMEDDQEINAISSKVYFAVNFKLRSVIHLGDSIRQSAFDIAEYLKPAKTILLSGDSKEAVFAAAKACSIDEYYAEYSPLMKKELIGSLRKRGNIVCMIGDGINDALAITEADIGISMTQATDISIQVSDILLTKEDLAVLPKLRFLSLYGASILKQNLFWAFFYNVIGIGLAVLGFLSPIFATFAMMASSLIVLYNAKRITYFKHSS